MLEIKEGQMLSWTEAAAIGLDVIEIRFNVEIEPEGLLIGKKKEINDYI